MVRNANRRCMEEEQGANGGRTKDTVAHTQQDGNGWGQGHINGGPESGLELTDHLALERKRTGQKEVRIEETQGPEAKTAVACSPLSPECTWRCSSCRSCMMNRGLKRRGLPMMRLM